jgi:hypothetical protein
MGEFYPELGRGWNWIDIFDIRAFHDVQIARHDGLEGVQE